MFDRIKSALRTLAYGPLRAGYDASKTTPENRRHWGQATDKPSVWEHTPAVRQKLRSRGRYEAENNSYCAGMVSTISTDTVGYVCPKLQVQTEDAGLNAYIEDEWEKWHNDPLVNLSAKLRILDEGKRIEGENFLALQTDEEVGFKTGVMMGITNLSSTRVSDLQFSNTWIDPTTFNDDGVVIDVRTGRPKYYKVIPPADEIRYGGVSVGYEAIPVPSRYILHWFAPRRAGQFRGVCEYTAALPLFAQLRRYDLATLTAAETAAMLAGIMKTNLPVSEPAKVTDWTKTELERGTLLSLPEGWDAMQFKPEQPIATYMAFVDCILRQIGRVLDMPFGIIAGDSSKYNYSSARLDYTGYDERLKFDRNQLCIRVLTPLFYEWFIEFAKMDSRVLKARSLTGQLVKHSWQFTKRPSIDPQKDANTSTENLLNGTSNLAIECAKDGKNWEEVLRQRAKEKELMKELGLDPVDEANALKQTKQDKVGAG